MKHMRWLGITFLALATTGLFAGCNGDDGGSSDSGGSSVVGTWGVKEGTSVTPESATSWWSFRSDGTFTYFNDAGLTSPHLGGTYSQDGNTFVGSFVNPGVGDGNIEGTLSDDGKTFQMDFIEHWHSPSKHVPLAGVRL